MSFQCLLTAIRNGWMEDDMSDTVYLLLESGKVFKGKRFGAKREAIGEIVFTTGMTGYLETLTDPSYYGQIIVQTFPLIGNYGIIPEDFESKMVGAAAYIVKDWCQEPSNFRCEGTLDAFLNKHNIPGMYGIDTRALTKIIREYGTLNGIITTSLKEAEKLNFKSYTIHNPVAIVSTQKIYEEKPKKAKFRVALIDFGLKGNIKKELLKRGCDLTVFPYNATKEDILSSKPDGIMLTNGPGDPKDNKIVISNLKEIIETNTPIFGICLGHQLLALANGFQTTKLKYGHRGANQPVRDLATGRIYITSQNHGYAVKNDSINKTIAVQIFNNLNDGTCEGIEYKNHPVFSVQFHPEACGGPHDTQFLFDKFIEIMEVNKYATK
jgi:carbamoyl-phosphate synthase small subunit